MEATLGTSFFYPPRNNISSYLAKKKKKKPFFLSTRLDVVDLNATNFPLLPWLSLVSVPLHSNIYFFKSLFKYLKYKCSLLESRILRQQMGPALHIGSLLPMDTVQLAVQKTECSRAGTCEQGSPRRLGFPLHGEIHAHGGEFMRIGGQGESRTSVTSPEACFPSGAFTEGTWGQTIAALERMYC